MTLDRRRGRPPTGRPRPTGIRTPRPDQATRLALVALASDHELAQALVPNDVGLTLRQAVEQLVANDPCANNRLAGALGYGHSEWFEPWAWRASVAADTLRDLAAGRNQLDSGTVAALRWWWGLLIADLDAAA